jgi:outer membrane protein OmpA-like peptidoglycan-associated protein
MKKVIKWVGLAVLILGLTACAKNTPGACSKAGLKNLVYQVELVGGQFVQLGDQVLVTVPSWRLFLGNSNNLTPKGKALLLAIGGRLACYRSEATGVKSYAGTLPSERANVSLAAQRASVVADVLARSGVGHLIYQRSFFVNNCLEKCRLNRIEIVTNRLP